MRINKLLIFMICSFLCSAIITFFGFRNRQPVETIKIEEEEEKEGIVEKGDFFARPSGRAVENIIFFINIGILFFFWENSKNNKKQPKYAGCCNGDGENNYWLNWCKNCYDACHEVHTRVCCSANLDGSGLCEMQNWFGCATFISFCVIVLFVEFVLNFFLIGSIAHLFRKDKDKKYFHTLKMFWKKIVLRKINLDFAISCIGFAFLIILIAKLTPKYCEIIEEHNAKCCLCFLDTLKMKKKKQTKKSFS